MPEIRRWPLDRAAWIPLRESHKCDEEGEFGREGYREGFVGAGTIAFLVEDRPVCEHLGWHDIGISHSQRGGCFSDGRYPPAGVFLSRVPADQPTEGRSSWQNVFGTHLVLEQYSDEGPPEWLLNQDIVVTLDLIREGDSWLCRERGYEEAALLTRKEDGTPMRLAIKSAYLKDYLCARCMALRVSSYRSRAETVANRDHIDWTGDSKVEEGSGLHWEGRTRKSTRARASSGACNSGARLACSAPSELKWTTKKMSPPLRPEKE